MYLFKAVFILLKPPQKFNIIVGLDKFFSALIQFIFEHLNSSIADGTSFNSFEIIYVMLHLASINFTLVIPSDSLKIR